MCPMPCARCCVRRPPGVAARWRNCGLSADCSRRPISRAGVQLQGPGPKAKRANAPPRCRGVQRQRTARFAPRSFRRRWQCQRWRQSAGPAGRAPAGEARQKDVGSQQPLATHSPLDGRQGPSQATAPRRTFNSLSFLRSSFRHNARSEPRGRAAAARAGRAGRRRAASGWECPRPAPRRPRPPHPALAPARAHLLGTQIILIQLG